jgi:uncharacterized protein YlxW (UPF0749 family)
MANKSKEAVKQDNIKSLEESVEDLKTQLKEYQEKAEYFKNMSLKASGALEVLGQLMDNKED